MVEKVSGYWLLHKRCQVRWTSYRCRYSWFCLPWFSCLVWPQQNTHSTSRHMKCALDVSHILLFYLNILTLGVVMFAPLHLQHKPNQSEKVEWQQMLWKTLSFSSNLSVLTEECMYSNSRFSISMVWHSSSSVSSDGKGGLTHRQGSKWDYE